MIRCVVLVGLFVAACDGGMSPVSVDGAVSPDAAPADAAVDAPVSPFSFEPASIDFGHVPTGTFSAPIRVLVVSPSAAISGFALSISGDDPGDLTITQTTCSSTISGGGCSFDLEFGPSTDGDHNNVITAMAPGQLPASASIHALGGVDTHPFGQGMSYLDFGVVTVGSTSSRVVTYTNSGTTTLPPASFMFAGESPDQYYLTDDHCTGVQLAPMETCTVTVVYAPTAWMTPGAAILYGTAQDTDELDLRADAGAATSLSISPASHDFGNVGPAPSAEVPFTITNTGSVTATGFAEDIYNAQFSITSSTCTSLAPGDSCVMNVQLAPTATGPDGGGMRVYSANASEASAGFTAIGIPAEGVILDTWDHDFGTAEVGTTGDSYTFTVTNVGTTATPVTLSMDDDATDFTIAQDHCSSTSLGAGATCTFQIVFTPLMYSDRFARIHATSSSNDAIAHLTGSATPGDQPLHVIPGSYNYSNDAIGSIYVMTFDVASQGGTTKVPAMSLTGPDAGEFQLVNDACTGTSLASGQSCTVDVWYRPAVVGMNKSANLVATWATGSSSAALTGGAFQVAGPFVNSDPPSYDFGTVTVGQTASVTLPFTNHGTATSDPMSFLMSGIDPSQFSLINDTCTGVALANNASCTVTVVFSPTSSGTKHGALEITIPGGGNDTRLIGVGQ